MLKIVNSIYCVHASNIISTKECFCVVISISFFVLNPVIPYRYTQLEYNFTENATTTQVCVETVTGNLQFVPGGYLTIEFFTSNLTAIG